MKQKELQQTYKDLYELGKATGELHGWQKGWDDCHTSIKKIRKEDRPIEIMFRLGFILSGIFMGYGLALILM